MQSQQKIEDSGLSPSFSCYFSDSLPSKAVTKVIREEDFDKDEFEFSFVLNENDEDSPRDIYARDLTAFPIFNRGQDGEVKPKDDKIDISVSINSKLFIDEQHVSSSYASSVSEDADSDDGLENIPSGTFCVWKPKAESESSLPAMTKCKKSSSTGTGSKRCSICYLLMRSKSQGKDHPMVLLAPKKVDSPKPKRNSGEVISKSGSRLKAQTPVHELFYVQRRAENEIVKKKSFLPYRQDVFGLFGNVNGIGKLNQSSSRINNNNFV